MAVHVFPQVVGMNTSGRRGTALTIPTTTVDRIGKTVNVQVIRGGVLIELAIALGERPTS
ncbi:hypothetical protein [Nostoc sp.]|uniref:hypothetical protein n=1 Tax=Nostoc sp. TaxID=1180 RepID=UPI0035935BC3